MVEVRKDVVDALVNYLALRPYREVAQLITELITAINAKPKPKAEPKIEKQKN